MSVFNRLMGAATRPASPFNMAGTAARPPQLPAAVASVPVPPSVVAPRSPFAGVPVDLGPAPVIDTNPGAMDVARLAVETPTVPQRGGLFDRIGEFLGSDVGRGALLRSGAATLQGGLGAGIQAGASWVDQRRQQDFDQQERDRQFELRERGVDIDQQQADTQAMNTASMIRDRAVRQGIDVATLEEAIRKNQAGELLDAAELQALQWYRREQLALGHIEEAGRNNRTAISEAGADRRHSTPSGSTVYTQTSIDGRTYNPGPSMGSTTNTTILRDEEGTETGRTTVRSPVLQSAYEGQQVIGPDGRPHIIRNGQPVPLSQAR